MSFLSRKILMGSGAEEETDDDFNLVSALYHFDGTNGGDNNTFSDTSGNSHSLTRNGNPTQGTFTPFSADDGKWSNHFELGDAIMTTSSGSSIAYDQSTFTCEAWILTTGASLSSTNLPGLVVLDGAANFGAAALSLMFGTLADYKLGIAWYNLGWITCYTTSATVTAGAWTHVAVSVSSNTIKLFINGTEITSLSGTTTLSNRSQGTQGYVSIGGTYYASSYSYQGFVSNCRIVDGTALYSEDFTPSTSPLTAVSGTDVLACTSRNFDGVNAAGSSVAMTLRNTPKVLPSSPFAPSASYVETTNGGSGYFDGTGDYLSITNESDLTPDTGDFTIECWVYFTDTTTQEGIFQFDTTPLSLATYIAPVLFTGASSYAGRWATMKKYGGDAVLYADTDHNPRRYEWYHTAVVRTSNTVKVFVNGVQVIDDFTDASDFSDRDSIVIGTAYDATHCMAGYISGFRYVKGTAVYTSAFTPPTAPPTAVTNTELLLNFTNAAMFDSAMKGNISGYGNAQLDTSVKKLGTASAEFDGTGDYLYVRNNFGIGTGDFTVECFVYLDTVEYTGIWQLDTTPLSGNGYIAPVLEVTPSGGSGPFVWSTMTKHGGDSRKYSSVTPSASTWYHTAVVRTSGTIKVFVDGTQVISDFTDTTNFMDRDSLVIGGFFSTTYLMDGYIDEFRITNKARYTSNFTAPTKAFPNK